MTVETMALAPSMINDHGRGAIEGQA